MSETQSIYNQLCVKCSQSLTPPYIKCKDVACHNLLLCLKCYAKGVEINAHKSDHSYVIIKDNFPLHQNTNWSAAEEIQLLKAIEKCGYGNWLHVAKLLKTKSPAECKNHYNYYYISNRETELLPKMRMDIETSHGIIIPYNFRTKGIEDPPRFASDSVSYNYFAGYNCARSDFVYNFDESAESIVSSLNEYDLDPEDDLIRELKCGVFRIYNKRLSERSRRYEIIRRHGLILNRKHVASMYRYEELMPKQLIDQLQVFMQLMNGIDFDYIMESLLKEFELKHNLRLLFDYRSKGITTFYGVQLYKRLLKKRQKIEQSVERFCNQPDLFIAGAAAQPTNRVRQRVSAFTLLEISAMPGYERLNAEEVEFCRNLRFVPEAYEEFKNVLSLECQKLGGVLSLKNARRVMRIDVNKTRKLYDFLIGLGYIKKPAHVQTVGGR